MKIHIMMNLTNSNSNSTNSWQLLCSNSEDLQTVVCELTSYLYNEKFNLQRL